MVVSDHRQETAFLRKSRSFPMPDCRHSLRTLSLILLMGFSSQAFGQLGGARIDRPLDTPVFSPYLNMLRSGGPALNYYGLVRPQLDTAQQNQQFDQNLQALQMQQSQGMRMVPGSYGYGYSQLGMTGHPVFFNTNGNGQFSGGYVGFNGGGGFGGGGFSGGGFGGSGYGGGGNFGGGGFNQMGGQPGLSGYGVSGVSPGFSGVSGHPAQFGGIGNSSHGSVRSR